MGKCCVIYIHCLQVAITTLERGCDNPYYLQITKQRLGKVGLTTGVYVP